MVYFMQFPSKQLRLKIGSETTRTNLTVIKSYKVDFIVCLGWYLLLEGAVKAGGLSSPGCPGPYYVD